MSNEYVGKWVVVRRYPNAQNDHISKIQCIYVVEETANQIYGSETDEYPSKRYHYGKGEIVRVISKEEKHLILENQRVSKINYKKDLEFLQAMYSQALDKIAKGTREEPFALIQNAGTTVFTQQRCVHDGALGLLTDLSIDRDPVFRNPIAVRTKWMCQQCHNIFEYVTPYLEITKM